MPIASLLFIQWYQREFSPISEKRMWIDGQDVKDGNIVLWPQKGTATILCRKFSIAFEGVSWSEATLIASNYQIDGRYGGMSGPDSLPEHGEMGNEVQYDYSYRKREFSIIYKNHRFVYCDYLHTLEADSKKYSTAQKPVHLWVSKQGAIKQLQN